MTAPHPIQPQAARPHGSVANNGPTQNTLGPNADSRLAYTRARVRQMLEKSDSFKAMPQGERAEIASNTLDVINYLSEPEGVSHAEIAKARRAKRLAKEHGLPPAPTAMEMRNVRARDMPPPRSREMYIDKLLYNPPPERVEDHIEDKDLEGFTAQAAREGAEVAGLLLEKVNFVDFVGGLITNVFTAIVDSAEQQMKAYAELVKSVAQTLNQFRDENVTQNQARDHIVDAFPQFFEITTGGGMFDGFGDMGNFGGGFSGDLFGGSNEPRVKLKNGVDEQEALNQVRNRFPGENINSLDSDTIEQRLVPAARTELATSRQQLLATMVLMGINRIIVTDGRISAKVLYTFRARDTYAFQRRAVDYDYGDREGTTVVEDIEEEVQGRNINRQTGADGSSSRVVQGGNRWTKGTTTTKTAPIVEMMSAVSEGGQSQLDTSAQLAGTVDVNFKSETFPLEKMADSFQIGMIQNASSRPKAVQGSTGEAAEGGAAPAPGADGNAEGGDAANA